MGDHARAQNGFASMQQLALVANLEKHRALHDIEPFILIKVKVNGRTTLEEILMFNREESAVCVAGCDLEADGTESQRVRSSEAILPGPDDMNFACGLGGLFECESLERSDGKHGACGFEKGTALHGFLH